MITNNDGSKERATPDTTVAVWPFGPHQCSAVHTSSYRDYCDTPLSIYCISLYMGDHNTTGHVDVIER